MKNNSRFSICWRSSGKKVATHVKSKIEVNKLIHKGLLKKLRGKLCFRIASGTPHADRRLVVRW